jgi:hypothetical protein
MSVVVSSQYGATTGAAESLIAQLTPPRRENEKKSTRKRNFKANERLHKV